MRRRSHLLFGLALTACSASPSLGPPGENHTSPANTLGGGGDDEVADQGDTSSADTNDLPGCNPVTDPTDECGPGMDCEPYSGTCVDASGTLALGEACEVEGMGDLCSAGLICNEGRCRSPCDPYADVLDPNALGLCLTTDVCVVVEADWGVCLKSCSLTLQDCTAAGEACNRAEGNKATVAACTRNPGSAVELDPCSTDGDCLAGSLCTSQSLHASTCANAAASCCASICDSFDVACVGAEISCYALGIAGQETAGYCGGF